MAGDQLPLFQRKTYKGIYSQIPLPIRLPTPESTLLQTLHAYHEYLKSGGFSKYTPDDFTGDIKKFGLFLKEKQLKEITTADIRGWISFLKTPAPKGEGLQEKTVSRKISSLTNYFLWLSVNKTILDNPMAAVTYLKVTAPLPEILFEDECQKLLTAASENSRSYLVILLLLEVGLKAEELFELKISRFDFSNKYAPEVWVKHDKKKERKDRKLKLPTEIGKVFQEYISEYKIDDLLFPYTQRFVRYLIKETADDAGIKKPVSAQILRDTFAVRQIKRGERLEDVLKKIGLSESTWEDAKVKYLKLAMGGI